ncbi:MaoC family dehydratase [Alloalcanivorax sp.]|jgi:acyl dehydratase|uniref:MaoC family dehydratase n=2 Tax=Alcanivoracaceae TaxID=224372 RepID=UPI000C94B7DA|nr:dehydratase [Alcanivorax sp.]MCH9782566.1 MaoC family dehydratase [Gammaproteobacteria bacterium]MEA3261295.1 MaoC family dehydratase [Pseudomonadota bacterium]MCH2553092.1 MaoC family dehydratase [Alcanivorax sp.]MEC8880292.1 MaoC family dehydratase [Pseudomonadota bacterium]|tara:strand:- start:36988 stop:37446 length:459 start_codon:yes stop_codon:yes gene_type:complete
MLTINGPEELKSWEGKELGVTEWMTVSQERINQFADATGDHQWIHVDVERAKKESPMGGPIAHGYLTLSLIPMFKDEIYTVEGAKAGLNYGLNSCRFLTPVPAGGRVRGRFVMKSVAAKGEGRYLLCNEVTIELEGSDKPACVAESLGMVLF